jgi:3-hydroxyisobutyryl-CoA hydrolase
VSAFKIATENTVLSIPECRVGHFSDASNSFVLSRLEGHLGVYLALTGDQNKAEGVL